VKNPQNRRRFLAFGAGVFSAASCKAPLLKSESGAHMRPYGERSPFETPLRVIRELTASPGTGSSRTPHADLFGTITPSALHFERHHSGVPAIDPAKHELLIHGLVDNPIVLSLADIKRFPGFSRIYFLECGGNSIGEQSGNTQPDVQRSHGLLSCSEWTGVPLKTVLESVGVQPAAKWMIAEGADAGRMARSIPMEKVLDDALLVYGQNGEALRPEQGYPLRLFLPGWEGNTNVKWLHRLQFAAEPAMSAKETAYYTELGPDGKAQIFTFVMEARSVITRPSGLQKIAPGLHEITGLAWTGRGKITQVEVSTDGGKTWAAAVLQQPVLPLAAVRFHFPWSWDGTEAIIQSRCTDETGFLQPTHDELIAARGSHSGYHYNAIKPWRVAPDGSVSHV
jgi:sulfane dehydrogenase subunit SoxC